MLGGGFRGEARRICTNPVSLVVLIRHSQLAFVGVAEQLGCIHTDDGCWKAAEVAGNLGLKSIGQRMFTSRKALDEEGH